ncbi:MAG: putative ABC transporter permease [Atopobiaceae bacterium]|nr:putative ABC transporter permease [Atopobiaceae bacterium]MCI2172987.1 putative ABC transporter permease [Atopobiaceae bacterium]MCI2208392.1 putative ABC transporter permease [Atopobiaceae bacterium]
MISTLVMVFVAVAAIVLVATIIRSVNFRAARGREFSKVLGDARVPDDIRLMAEQIGLDRAARKTLHKGDSAYEAMRTKPKPRLSTEQRRALTTVRKRARADYLDNMTPGMYHYVIIFIVASVAGLFAEMLFMAITSGRTESRVGLVWGPFSPLYGFGAVLLTAILWSFRKAPTAQVFVVSALMGGALEQVTGMCMEYFAHAQSWTYIGLPDAITQWIAWRFLLMWGIVGLIWCRLIMPEVIFRIGEPTTNAQIIGVSALTIFLALDVVATVYCFYRKAQRDAGVPATNAIERYVDDHFSDEFIADRFQNLVVGSDLAPNGS